MKLTPFQFTLACAILLVMAIGVTLNTETVWIALLADFSAVFSAVCLFLANKPNKKDEA